MEKTTQSSKLMQKKHLKNSTPLHDLKEFKVGIERNCLNIINGNCEKTSANTTVKRKLFLFIQGALATLATSIQYILARTIKQDKETKGIQIEKEEVKPTLFADDILLCTKCQKFHTHTHTHTKC